MFYSRFSSIFNIILKWLPKLIESKSTNLKSICKKNLSFLKYKSVFSKISQQNFSCSLFQEFIKIGK